MLAKYYTYALGTGSGNHRLDSIDAALLDAGIGNLNLVRISSILPPGCIQCKEPLMVHGQIIYCAYTDYISGNYSAIISAAIGIAIPNSKMLPGVITEHSGEVNKTICENTVTALCLNAMERRGVNDYKVEIRSIEAKVKDEFCCVFAGIVLND